MHLIPTRVHAVTDYILGIALIAVPYFVSDTRGTEMIVPMVIGLVVLLQSLITDYEFSGADIIPMRGHLAMDAIAGGFLAVSPWLFGFADIVFWPHVIVGVLMLLSAVATEKYRRDRPANPNPPGKGERPSVDRRGNVPAS